MYDGVLDEVFDQLFECSTARGLAEAHWSELSLALAILCDLIILERGTLGAQLGLGIACAVLYTDKCPHVGKPAYEPMCA